MRSLVLGPAAAQEGWQQQRMQALNKVADPLHEDDPIRNPEFRDDYMHADGSINECVQSAPCLALRVCEGGWLMPRFLA